MAIYLSSSFCSSWLVYVATYCSTESLRAMNVTSRCESFCGGAGSLARKVHFSLRRAMSGAFGTSAIMIVRSLEQRGALQLLGLCPQLFLQRGHSYHGQL